ncbi:hypothetical protein ACEPPN_012103 [Leptodophora sp. 'Broadleaf-Isolate-01']
MFHDQDDPQTRIIQSRIQQQLDDLGKTPEGLLRDWATLLLKDELGILENGDMLSLLRSQYDNFDRLDIEVVIAVPPGRTNIAHSQVLEAFIQPPLTSASVSLESEPAAMFRSWIEAGQDTQDWVVGKRYLAADGGGRTCILLTSKCFVRFRLDRLNPLGFTQEFASETRGVPTNFKNRDWEISRMRNDFELKYKQHVGRGVRLDLVFKRSEVGMSFLGSLKSFSDEAESCFDSCVAKLILRMLRQLDKGKSGEPADVNKINGDFFTRYLVTTSKAITTLLQVTPELGDSTLYSSLHTTAGDFDGLEYFWSAEYLVKKGDEPSAGKGISSESSVNEARTRHIEPGMKRAEYCDTILTFAHQPENDDKWAAWPKDGSWMDQRGNQIPSPMHSEDITWNPYSSGSGKSREPGVAISDLDQQRTSDGKVYKVLRYSPELQVSEVGTNFWVKVFSSVKKKRKTHKNVAQYPRVSRIASNLTLEVAKVNPADQPRSTPEQSQKDIVRQLAIPNGGVTGAPTMSSVSGGSNVPTNHPVDGRRNGPAACWMCTLRDEECRVQQYSCKQCMLYGSKCDGGNRPPWWDNEYLRQAESSKMNKTINSYLTKIARDALQSRPSKNTNTFHAINRRRTSSVGENNASRLQVGWQEPPVNPPPPLPVSSNAFPEVLSQPTSTKALYRWQVGEDDDIYTDEPTAKRSKSGCRSITPGMTVRGRHRRSKRSKEQKTSEPGMTSWKDVDDNDEFAVEVDCRMGEKLMKQLSSGP